MRFLLLHSLEWNARDLRNDVHHVVGRHHDFFFFALLAPLVENGVELFLGLLLLVAEGCGLFEILRLDSSFLFQPNFFYVFLDILYIGGPRHGVDPCTRTGLIHYIDGLVGKKSSCDIPIRKSDGGLERLVGEFCLMVRLVLGSKTFQDLNGFINRGRIDLYRLETPLQRRVFLDILAVFVHRGRADTLQFATTQRGLDNVRSVHCAFGRACPHDGVQLVDEKNDVLGTANFVHDGFDALFELTTIFCPSYHQRQIQGDHPPVAQQFRHVAVCDLLRQSFCDGRFADACFADQNWIVLCSPAKHLNHPFNLIAPANYRIEFSFPCQLGQITAKCPKCRCFDVFLSWLAAFLLRFGWREIRIKLFENLVARAFDVELETLEHSGSHALAFAQKPKQDMFRANVGMIERLGFLAG